MLFIWLHACSIGYYTCFVYLGKSSREAQPAPFTTYLHLMKKFENRINVIRGTIDYYYLAGPDPPSTRPKWFVVTPRRSTFVPNEVRR